MTAIHETPRRELPESPVDGPFEIRPLDERRPALPLVFARRPGASAEVDDLAGWIAAHRAFVDRSLLAAGAVLLRGFAVDTAEGFERVALAASPDLKNDYLGTSPRDALSRYVFSASELPPFYPIPEHCEMSFIPNPPARLFFACLVAPQGGGGETPIVDFRRVLADLPADVRRRFQDRGVCNIRNYAGKEGKRKLDPWKLKRWDEMFQTDDRAKVEDRCRENGFEFTWLSGDRLRLVNTQPAVKPHPVTGEPVWFNHAQVFHLSSVPGEYRRIAERQGRVEIRLLAEVAKAMVFLKRRLTSPLDQGMHCTFGDGTPIPDQDMEAVRDAIWKNMVFFPWQKGDVILIDNHAVAHGRMPYRGPRQIAVAWA